MCLSNKSVKKYECIGIKKIRLISDFLSFIFDTCVSDENKKREKSNGRRPGYIVENCLGEWRDEGEW